MNGMAMVTSGRLLREARKKVLVVDDSESMLRSVRTLIGEEFDVVTAASVLEGRKFLECDRFDSIITDYDMGDGTGFELIDFLNESGIELPVILITAYGSKELAVKTLKHHIFGYLEKPFDPEELCRLLNSALLKKTRGESERKLADFGLRSGELFHEIATPLTLISLKVTELKGLIGDRAREPRIGRAFDLLDSQLDRLRKIIHNSRERLKSNDRASASFPVDALLALVREQCAPAAKRAGVMLSMEPAPFQTLQGDRDRLLQVFVNLINNSIDAVAAMPERWVRVSATREEASLVLRVTDSGHGVPPEVRSKLFSPLFTTKMERGTGLGLSIAHRIVREHQGELSYNPDSPHTEFVVRLPAAQGT
ncbi:MAG: response regulator [Oligoflexia bacterium]|nr:response regulator [Oligoflexia bacterium]